MAAGELKGVEIVSGSTGTTDRSREFARYAGREHWFEAEPAFEPYGPRPLFLYPAADDELARERELDRLYQEQAKGKPVDEWPSVLR